MVLLARHEESIKARLCFAFSINLSNNNLEQLFIQSFTSLESWVLNLDLDSWDLEPWIFLDSLELFFDWSLSFLSSSFVIIIVIIKTSLNHSWFTMKLCFYIRVLPDPWVTIAKLRLFHGLGQKTLTSPERVQMTILVSVCQQAHLPLADERCG